MTKIDGQFGPLGKNTRFNSDYDPRLLFPISRQESRSSLKTSQNQDVLEDLLARGHDQWLAYEASWLGKTGKPEVAILDINIPAGSPYTVESKSLKLYLNSLNQKSFENRQAYIACISGDLEKLCQTKITINSYDMHGNPTAAGNTQNPGLTDLRLNANDFTCIDELDIQLEHREPSACLLQTEQQVTHEKLCSHLFRSNCPVTNQPDWASIYIEYKGHQINHQSLLAYICSFRKHNGFHEQCIEQMFLELLAFCKCEDLSIEGRFLRRGGIDINPFRSTSRKTGFAIMSARQ